MRNFARPGQVQRDKAGKLLRLTGIAQGITERGRQVYANVHNWLFDSEAKE